MCEMARLRHGPAYTGPLMGFRDDPLSAQCVGPATRVCSSTSVNSIGSNPQGKEGRIGIKSRALAGAGERTFDAGCHASV